MLTKDLDGPLDDCGDLGKDELENLEGWRERFDEKVRTHVWSDLV
jgi:membrane-associated progesterone receptor component